ncbi:MAG: PA2817 family protein [Oceanicoccus sp.]|uniref:PA2817 family protein n=1 Tax=Oceanicoccus sp. TaxID=2691044 RepID=UPI002637F44F|nr:PA2817 family protein [Oceanicoccus sp.]MDG1773668.1 PA2817 family protein [Oceanicoccus sp.]
MSDSSYFNHHHNLLQALYQHCEKQLPFCDGRATEVDLEFMETLKALSEATDSSETFVEQGQSIVCRIVTHYQHITPTVNRDLFWFFGGECLHYMADEELALYQQLDEKLHENPEESLDYTAVKASIFQLH